MKSLFVLALGIAFQASPQFEAVSVKMNTSGGVGNVIQMPPTGRVNIVNVTLRLLLTRCFGVPDHQLIAGPQWMNSDRFDIQTSPPADYQPEQLVPCIGMDCPLTRVQIMMQGVLADRFLLKSHRETRELPIYELAIARNGHKLKEVPPPPERVPGTPPPGAAPATSLAGTPALPPGAVLHFGSGIAGSAVQFSALVSTLSLLLDRPIVDKTGIKGYYDFKMVFSRAGLPNVVGGTPLRIELGPVPGAEIGASDSAPSIFTAVQEYLGLKLDSGRGPAEVLVIDSVEKPKEN
jgi:uncharacterized protein (TIGR03435 family)